MKLLIILLLGGLSVQAQMTNESVTPLPASLVTSSTISEQPDKGKIKLAPQKWKITRNHVVTGGLVFLAGASKGFNETLMFHWKGFKHGFPGASTRWFNPNESWRNKYKNGASFQITFAINGIFSF